MEAPEDLPIELRMTLAETNLILNALSELALRVSSGLIQKIQQQGEQQIAKPKSASTEKPAGGKVSP